MFGNETTAYAMRIISAILNMGLAYSPEICEYAGVPDAYGKQVLTKLARAGIVTSRKGRGIGCGIQINPQATEKPLAEVFSLFSAPRLPLDNAGSAGRVMDGILKGLETRTGSLTIGELK